MDPETRRRMVTAICDLCLDHHSRARWEDLVGALCSCEAGYRAMCDLIRSLKRRMGEGRAPHSPGRWLQAAVLNQAGILRIAVPQRKRGGEAVRVGNIVSLNQRR